MNKIKLMIEMDEETYKQIKGDSVCSNNNECIISKSSSAYYALNAIINATPITKSEDCVSRQAVMELLYKRYCHKEPYERKEGNTVYKGYDTYYMINFDKLKALPSVLLERKKGEWCEQNDDYFDWYECSECGYGSEGEMQYSSEHDVRTKYCPNCGAKMEGGAE